MISRTITLATLLSFGSLLQGVHGEAMPKLKSMTSEQFKSPEWVNEIQLSGTFRLGGKGFASLTTPREIFGWRKENLHPVTNLLNWILPSPNPLPSSKREISKHGSDFAQELCHAPAKLEPGI